MLKSKIFIYLAMISLLMCSCSVDSNDGGKAASVSTGEKQSNYYYEDMTATPIDIGKRLCDSLGFPDQSKPPEYYWINLSDTDDVEVKYDNMAVYLDKEVYSINSLIRIRISNKNNKPYSFYPIPYLDKWNADTNEWERMIYAPDEAYWASGWATGTDETTIYFNPYFVSEAFSTGQYRFLVFAGGYTFYSPTFSVEK